MKPPAYKLAHLLSTLPKEGASALVRPTKWPANSFYKVTRSNLKFRPSPSDAEVLRAGGKAWGQLFWKGKLVQPRASPASAIPGGLKLSWVEVPSSQLDKSTQQAIAAADQKFVEVSAERAEALAARRLAKRSRVEEAQRAQKEKRAATAARVEANAEAARQAARQSRAAAAQA